MEPKETDASILLQAITVQMAKEGNEEMQESLRIQNKLRAEKGLPTIEEALEAYKKKMK